LLTNDSIELESLLWLDQLLLLILKNVQLLLYVIEEIDARLLVELTQHLVARLVVWKLN